MSWENFTIKSVAVDDAKVSVSKGGFDNAAITVYRDIGYGKDKKTGYLKCWSTKNTFQPMSMVKKGDAVVFEGMAPEYNTWAGRDGVQKSGYSMRVLKVGDPADQRSGDDL